MTGPDSETMTGFVMKPVNIEKADLEYQVKNYWFFEILSYLVFNLLSWD